MNLIQILLPLRDQEEKPFSKEIYSGVKELLTKSFGGVTIYNRNAATGLWEDSEGETEKDDVIIFEVMTNQLNPAWWKNYRTDLEKQFRQDEIIIRNIVFEKI